MPAIAAGPSAATAATITPAEAGTTTTPMVPETTLSDVGSEAGGGSWLAHAAANAQRRRLQRQERLMRFPVT
jgi:hypothetical protein